MVTEKEKTSEMDTLNLTLIEEIQNLLSVVDKWLRYNLEISVKQVGSILVVVVCLPMLIVLGLSELVSNHWVWFVISLVGTIIGIKGTLPEELKERFRPSLSEKQKRLIGYCSVFLGLGGLLWFNHSILTGFEVATPMFISAVFFVGGLFYIYRR